MPTVVIAARQPQSQARYRALLEEAGVVNYLVTDLEQLIKFVRTRPVDIVLFDVGDARWPARKWLDAVAGDADLAAVPVVWVGSEATATDLQAIKDYRPGVYFAKCPDVATLREAMAGLAERVHPNTGSAPSSSLPVTPDWKPAGGTIDDALKIFESTKIPIAVVSPSPATDRKPAAKSVAAPGRPAGGQGDDYDWFVAEMVKTDAGAGQSAADSGFIDTGTPTGTEKGILNTGPHDSPFALSQQDTAKANDARMPKMQGKSDTDEPNAALAGQQSEVPADSALVDRIAGEVAARLAVEILKNLDHDAIRRAVEATLAHQR